VRRGTVLDLCYLVAAITFIIALMGLSSPRHARRGNLVAVGGMTLAIGATFAQPHLQHLGWMIGAMVLGAAVAVPTSRFVKMTAIPSSSRSSTASVAALRPWSRSPSTSR